MAMASAAASVSIASCKISVASAALRPCSSSCRRLSVGKHSIDNQWTLNLNGERRAKRLENWHVAAAEDSAPPPPPSATPTPSTPVEPRPTFSMKKGQIVRVEKEKYLQSVEYLAVGHPTYFKGLDYIYEDRGEVLDIRNFEAGEYALISWAGISTAPAWLPTYMLIKSDKLSYKRT